MNVTKFSFPAPTLFGAGAVSQLPDHLRELGIHRALVVTDPGLLKTDAFTKVQNVLGKQAQGKDWHLYSGVHPNPVETDIREAADACRAHHCDGIVGLGGGSALDVAKAARLLIPKPDLDFARFYEQKKWESLLPFIAIPTTAGTGSEVGRSSVVTLESTKRKAVLFHEALMAKLIILDPELTIGLPPKLTAATGADALTHCIESFTCPIFHPMCDGIALEGIYLIVDALPRAFANGQDIDARGRMLVAAAMGAVAFQKDLGVVHSLAHPLSTLCGFHHGLANALCLIAGMKFCSERKPGIYRRVGIACGLELQNSPARDADKGTITFLADFLSRLGLTGKLHEHGARADQIEALVEQAVDDPCHKTNVVPVSRDDFRKLYEELM
jgi:4-hydroxybutyrate dehydrogenase